MRFQTLFLIGTILTIPTLAISQTLNNNGVVTIADGGSVTLGSQSDPVCGSDTGSCTLVALYKRAAQTLTQLKNNLGDGSVAQPVYQLPQTTGGNLEYSFIAAASTNAANIKATVGQVFGVHCHNHAAYEVTVRLYNLAVSPTVGSSTIFLRFSVPAGSDIEYSRPLGVAFSTGISIAATKLIADTDTTVLVASDVTCNVEYF